jgi:hypothetical protein
VSAWKRRLLEAACATVFLWVGYLLLTALIGGVLGIEANTPLTQYIACFGLTTIVLWAWQPIGNKFHPRFAYFRNSLLLAAFYTLSTYLWIYHTPVGNIPSDGLRALLTGGLWFFICYMAWDGLSQRGMRWLRDRRPV